MSKLKAIAIFVVCLQGSSYDARANDSVDLSKQIDQLIRQLDDDSFRLREEAQRELVKIGKPALEVIRKAETHQSAEVRSRARGILRRLAGKEMEGMWQSDDQVLVIDGKHWWWGTIDDIRKNEFENNRITIVKISEEFVAADLLVGLGPRKGQTSKAIFRLNDDTLHYSGSYKSRPTGFKDDSGYAIEWKRVKNEPRSIDR